MPATSQANNLTFGVELECYVDPQALSRAGCSIGSYHGGRQIPNLPQGWNAQSDSSIRAPQGRVGMEIVSPVLRGEDGLKQVVKMLEWVRSLGAGCNASCGLHVHVGANKKTAWNLISLTAQHEKALLAACGVKGATRTNNQFAKSIKTAPIQSAWESMPHGPRDGQNAPYAVACVHDRYHTLNLSPLFSGNRQAVEFRVFAATFRTSSVLGAIRLCLGLVDYAQAASKPCKFESSETPHHASGVKSMKALLKRLKWGSAPSRWGNNWGWINNETISMSYQKTKLMELAKAFDSVVAPGAAVVRAGETGE